MLAWFVHGHILSRAFTPDYILVLFITSVLGTVWAIYTLFWLSHTKHNAYFVDFCFIGAFIASAWELRVFSNADCSDTNGGHWFKDLGIFGKYGILPWAADARKNCRMLKACFAFAIMNCFLWLFTGWLLLFMHKSDDREAERPRA
jgi:hypothetical protein